jgi:hypothetical protein
MSQLESRIREIRAEFPMLSRCMQGRPLVQFDKHPVPSTADILMLSSDRPLARSCRRTGLRR